LRDGRRTSKVAFLPSLLGFEGGEDGREGGREGGCICRWSWKEGGREDDEESRTKYFPIDETRKKEI
jgi:hypothetical protein